MLTMPLDTNSKYALYEQIYFYIKNEIKNGNLPYQTKLPSTRSLATNLSISRNTVDMAYSQLLSEGYVESSPKRGYFVNELSTIRPLGPSLFSDKETLNKKAPDKREEASPYRYDFSPFSVDLSHFPYHTWYQLSKNCLQDNAQLFLLGDNQGDFPLRHAITKYLHQSRGVNCREDQLIVGAGVDYLLQLLVTILGPEHTIAMENPAYQRANRIFNSYHMKTLPIPLDHQGMSVSILRQSNCNIAYVTPSHQYPLGIVMPIKRRIDLLNWANEFKDRYIIEDDHDSEFRYKGKPIPSLQGIATHDNVIYIGTFSRAIAPAIRVGYMVLPESLLSKYQKSFSYFSSTVSRIDQSILTEFLDEGYFERHLNRMRKIYKNKHDVLLNALQSYHLPIEISGENAGMHLIVKIKNGQTEESLIEKASAHRIHIYGLKEHFLEIPKDYSPTFLFGYANLSEKDIVNGIQLLVDRCLS
ncbi:MAG: PLP-dependent aminotransferase family protein [Acetivibrio sp.]